MSKQLCTTAAYYYVFDDVRGLYILNIENSK